MRNDFETGYLMHWGIKKGGKKENHKYYERVEKNGKYLYFYTQTEYEAWLNKGNKALDKTKNKAKGALSSLKSKFSNTKSSLLNAIGQGKSAAYQLANRSQTQLTKKNAQKAIDRGNKIISSILNTTSKQVSNTVNSVQKNFKAVSVNVSKKANSIVSKVTITLKKAGKDTAKAVQKYVSKGEKTIKQTLAKAGNAKLGSGTAKAEKSGSAVLTYLLASAAATIAVAAIRVIAPKVVKKAKELIDKIFHPETTVTVTTETTPKEVDTPKEKPPKDFASDAKDSYKEDRAQHSDVPQKDKPTTKDEDMAAVNPNYRSEEDLQRQEELAEDYYAALARGDMAEVERIYDEYMAIEDKYAGFTNNCMNCTLIYDLRRRGYDVDAPWNPNGTLTTSLFDWYDVTDDDFWEYGTNSDRPISKSDAKEIKNFIKDEYPEGAYGHLNLTWAGDGNGGHDCIWSIENGEVIIRDCQSNEVVKFEDYVTEASSVNWVRTDDKALKDLAYEVATADKANVWGEADRDEYEDDIYDTREYNDYVEDDGQETFKNDKDLVYDEYWRKAAGKKRK